MIRLTKPQQQALRRLFHLHPQRIGYLAFRRAVTEASGLRGAVQAQLGTFTVFIKPDGTYFS